MYSLEAQVHSIATIEKAKRYFTNLSLSTAGHTFKQIKFQIDTAATCNTMPSSTLRLFFPDAEIKRSPYRLHPYGNSKPLHPIGQVKLLCETHNKFDNLTFQVLPDSCMGIKPALLSGSDSEKLGLISVQTDQIPSLGSSADDSASTKHDDFLGFQFTPQVDACTPQNTAPWQNQGNLKTCNHLQQIHETFSPDYCSFKPSARRPTTSQLVWNLVHSTLVPMPMPNHRHSSVGNHGSMEK